jgi:hypothetical protein
MKQIIGLIFVLLLISCSQQEDKETHSMESQIIAALNLKDLPKADALINSAINENPNSAKFHYYKAQLHSLEADIDIYSLFPIVQMELFEFALTEWSAIDEYSDHFRGSTQDVLVGQQTPDSVLEIQDRIKEIEGLDLSEITYSIKIEGSYHNDFGSHKECYVYYEITSDLFPRRYKHWDNQYFQVDEMNCDNAEDKVVQESDRNASFVKRIAIREQNKLIKIKRQRKESNRIIKAMMSLYQSINVIKNVPNLHPSRFEKVEASLNTLMKANSLANSKRIKENTTKHQGLLAGYLILGGLKNSLDIDNIKEPADIVCKADAFKLVDQYRNFLTGFRYLHNAMIDTEFSKKNKEVFDKAKTHLEDASEELTEEQIDDYVDDIQDYQEDYC